MKVLGVGVDLVSITRIQKFLSQHPPARVARLLSETEKKRYRRKKLSAHTLAKIFASKEAFFKTLDEPWMGLEGFSSMETEFLSGGRFLIKTVSGALAKNGPREAEGTFFKAGKLLGAQVVRWQSSAHKKA